MQLVDLVLCSLVSLVDVVIKLLHHEGAAATVCSLTGWILAAAGPIPTW
jgi:hypothetical protein